MRACADEVSDDPVQRRSLSMTSADHDAPPKPPADPLVWAAYTAFSAILVALSVVLAQLCVEGDNRSDLYVRRCNSSLPDLPLLGFGILAVGYVLARALGKPWIRGVSLLLALGPAAITFGLLSV